MSLLQLEHKDKTVDQLSEGIQEKSVAEQERPKRPDPEVVEKPRRRRFLAAYKLKLLEESDRCENSEERGALLRREGVYHSNLGTWRHQRDMGQLAGLSPRKRGRKASSVNPLSEQVEKLERENSQLRRELEKAAAIIDVQKKISMLLDIPLAQSNIERSRP